MGRATIETNRSPFVPNPATRPTPPSSITSGVIRGYLQSENFVAGVSGWKIDRKGVIQALQLNIAGASTIAGWSVDNAKIFKTNAVLHSDGYVSFGATPPTGYGNNVGAWLGIDNALAKMSLYKDTNNYLQWDGDKLLFKTTNTELKSNGALTVSELIANSGDFAGEVTVGGDDNVKIDGANDRILISDGTNDRVLIGKF